MFLIKSWVHLSSLMEFDAYRQCCKLCSVRREGSLILPFTQISSFDLLLTPWSKVLLEKLTGSQPVKKFPEFYGTRMFITAFTSAHHLTLSWASPCLPILLPEGPSMRGSPKWSLSLMFPHQNPVYTFPLPHTCCMPHPSHSSRLDRPNNTWWGVQIIKLLIIKSAPFPCYLLPLRLKYSPQHPILKHPQPTFLPQCEPSNFITWLVTFSQFL
jgi:hypothetical protein